MKIKGVVIIGFIMIGVEKIIDLLILKKVGKSESFFNFWYFLDFVKNVIKNIVFNVKFVLVIVMNWLRNCWVMICLLFVIVNFFLEVKIFVFVNEFVCKIGLINLLIIVDLWRLNSYKNGIKKFNKSILNNVFINDWIGSWMYVYIFWMIVILNNCWKIVEFISVKVIIVSIGINEVKDC